MVVLALAAGLLLAACDDDGQAGDEAGQTAGVDGDAAGGEGEGEDSAAEGGPAGPPTEPADIPAQPGERSAARQGSTVTVTGDRAAFVTPTGNIACVLTEDGGTCQIQDKGYTPDTQFLVPDLVGECTAQDADAMMLTTAPAAWTCAPTELALTAALDQGGWWSAETDGESVDADGVTAAVLPYGETLAVGPVSCSSAQDAITCRSTQMGRQFILSDSRYNIGQP
jgi:hypothetical protein